MLSTMTERTFTDWQRFAARYPFGEDVQDHRFGRVMATMAAALGVKGKALNPEAHMLPAYTDKSAGAKPKQTVTEKIKASLGLPL